MKAHLVFALLMATSAAANADSLADLVEKQIIAKSADLKSPPGQPSQGTVIAATTPPSGNPMGPNPLNNGGGAFIDDLQLLGILGINGDLRAKVRYGNAVPTLSPGQTIGGFRLKEITTDTVIFEQLKTKGRGQKKSTEVIDTKTFYLSSGTPNTATAATRGADGAPVFMPSGTPSIRP